MLVPVNSCVLYWKRCPERFLAKRFFMDGIAVRLFLLPLILLLALTLLACKERDVPAGVVAEVNGESVSFRDLEAARSVLFAGRSSETADFDDIALQRQYRYVLGRIIEELLICQYMRGNQKDLDLGQLEAEEKRIREDYPPGGFEAMLLELAIDEGRWRGGLYRRLMVEQFIMQELRPEISISADEVELYYKRHSADFVIPEQWHFMQIVGTDGNEVKKAGDSLVSGKNAALAQKDHLVTIYDINMGADMLPKELLDDLSALRPWQASAVRNADDGFRQFVLVEKTPSSVLDAAETSKRVEQALADEKVRAVYAEWMQKRLRKAEVRIAPALAEPLPPRTAMQTPVKSF